MENLSIKVNSTPKHRLSAFLKGCLKLFAGVLMFVCFLAFYSANWYVRTFGRLGFGAVVNTVTTPMEGVESGVIHSYLSNVALAAITTPIVWYLLFGKFRFHLKISKIQIFPFKKWFSVTLAIIISVGSLANGIITSELDDYIASLSNKTTIYESEYVSPQNVNIKFPDEKRNLIYIFLESMEVSYMDKKNGGTMEENLIPELTKLAEENINFSHTDILGGAREGAHSGWTIAAMVAQSAGIPYSANLYGAKSMEDESFLKGATSLGDILHKNGYYQAVMFGSDSHFANRDSYYLEHGTDKIYDYNTAIQDGIIPKDHYVWWGMEDYYLYEYAKSELKKISKGDKPFAFTMLTVDTHFPEGYVCDKCPQEHKTQYDNVLSCSSYQVYEFVKWLKKQDFYEDTTIIISGDHCTMYNEYVEETMEEDYPRRVFNCIMNSAVDATNTKNRDFTTMDMFPTTLAAMGCTIEGNKLGMGVNLFSGEDTLTEKYGHERLKKELETYSSYYLENIMKLDQTSILYGNETLGYAITYKKGTQLFPLRKIAEKYNGTVNWEKSKTIVELGGQKYEIDTTDEKIALITWKDKNKKMHSKKYIYTTALNAMYVEETFFSDVLGLKYKSHKKEKTIVFE